MRAGLVLLGLLLDTMAQAHGLAPLLMRIEESGGRQLAVALKTSRSLETSASPQFPAHCSLLRPPRSETQVDAVWRHWELSCSQSGGSIRVPELGDYNVVVDYHNAQGRRRTALLSRSRPEFRLDGDRRPMAALVAAVASGAHHLIMGLDHLLFIAGLTVLLRPRPRQLLLAASAFSLGHSATLALVSLGWLVIPQACAELAIAASLIVLGWQILRPGEPRRGMLRVALLPTGFGLIHGLGFAGALSTAGLSGMPLVLMLLGFNLGIELGQLACIAAVLAALAMNKRRLPGVEGACAYIIGSCAVFWLWERALSLAA